jgi:hypothetical protein
LPGELEILLRLGGRDPCYGNLDDVIDDSIVREIEKESVIERLYR